MPFVNIYPTIPDAEPEKFVVPKTPFCVPKAAKRRQISAFSVPIFPLRRTFSARFCPKTQKTFSGEHFKIGRFTPPKWHFWRPKAALSGCETATFEAFSNANLNAKTPRRKVFFEHGDAETQRLFSNAKTRRFFGEHRGMESF